MRSLIIIIGASLTGVAVSQFNIWFLSPKTELTNVSKFLIAFFLDVMIISLLFLIVIITRKKSLPSWITPVYLKKEPINEILESTGIKTDEELVAASLFVVKILNEKGFIRFSYEDKGLVFTVNRSPEMEERPSKIPKKEYIM